MLIFTQIFSCLPTASSLLTINVENPIKSFEVKRHEIFSKFWELWNKQPKGTQAYLLDTFFSSIFLITCWLLSNKTQREQFYCLPARRWGWFGLWSLKRYWKPKRNLTNPSLVGHIAIKKGDFGITVLQNSNKQSEILNWPLRIIAFFASNSMSLFKKLLFFSVSTHNFVNSVVWTKIDFHTVCKT